MRFLAVEGCGKSEEEGKGAGGPLPELPLKRVPHSFAFFAKGWEAVSGRSTDPDQPLSNPALWNIAAVKPTVRAAPLPALAKYAKDGASSLETMHTKNQRWVTRRPKFCSMNYSSKVDDYNKQVHGIEKKDFSELVEKLVSQK